MRKALYMLCVFALIAVCNVSPIQGAVSANRIVAVVNGEMVSMYDLELIVMPQIMRLQLNPATPQGNARIKQLMQAELSHLIDEIVIAQEAEHKGISIDDDTIDTEFERFAGRSGLDVEGFIAVLQKQGTTEADVKEKIRKGMLRTRLLANMVTRKIVVTDENIAEYLATNPEFTAQNTAKRVTLGLLIYPSSVDAKAAAKRITKGALTFEKAVQKFSVGPKKDQGGNIGELNFADLDPILREHLSRLKIGQVTPLFDLNGMQTQAKLLDRESAKPVATAEEPNREAAAEYLRGIKSQERFIEYMSQLRARAVIDNRF